QSIYCIQPNLHASETECCGEITNVKNYLKWVMSYYWISSSCPRHAIVFKTIAGKEICVDPETSWVNGHVDKVDKRTTTAAKTTATE
uniref:Chemokine interleukin-8-like domain-containing protein n=1 Tax=Cyprinus carpio TaxID=7962 RepID=A0A8C1J6A9_CYPCA